MNFKALPKIELHLHLDCSIAYEAVQSFYPGITREQYTQDFVAPPKCYDLADFLKKASASIAFLQSEATLRATMQQLFEQLKDDGVWYAEIRFAPLLHTEQGLSPVDVMNIVSDSLRLGIEQTGIHAGLILCTLRHYDKAKGMATVDLAEAFLKKGVVGFDIAADEASYGIDEHIAVFQYARQKGIPCTAHAGEARGADSIWETLRFFEPQRIGHGVRCVEDPALVSHLAKQGIHLEVCPSSNIQTNVFDNMAGHPLPQLYEAGISVGINTDGRSLCGVSLSEEYEKLHRQFGWGKLHFLQCNLHAIEAAFASPALKATLTQKMVEAYGSTS